MFYISSILEHTLSVWICYVCVFPGDCWDKGGGGQWVGHHLRAKWRWNCPSYLLRAEEEEEQDTSKEPPQAIPTASQCIMHLEDITTYMAHHDVESVTTESANNRTTPHSQQSLKLVFKKSWQTCWDMFQ